MLEVAEKRSVVGIEIANRFDELEVIGSPGKLGIPNGEPHSPEDSEKKRCPDQHLELRLRLLQESVSLLDILEHTPAKRLRDKILGAPPAFQPVELGTFLLEDPGEEAVHRFITSSR